MSLMQAHRYSHLFHKLSTQGQVHALVTEILYFKTSKLKANSILKQRNTLVSFPASFRMEEAAAAYLYTSNYGVILQYQIFV